MGSRGVERSDLAIRNVLWAGCRTVVVSGECTNGSGWEVCAPSKGEACGACLARGSGGGETEGPDWAGARNWTGARKVGWQLGSRRTGHETGTKGVGCRHRLDLGETAAWAGRGRRRGRAATGARQQGIACAEHETGAKGVG